MFHPTQFPCTAWCVTKDVDVLSVLIPSQENFDRGGFIFVCGTDRIYATRDEAVVEAEVRLACMHDAYVRAGQRWTKAAERVAKLKGGSV